MRTSTALLISSGTATLEAACFGTPMVVVYRLSALSYLVGRFLVRIPDIGLVNVVAGERIVPELVQGAVTARRMAEEVRPFLVDPALRSEVSSRLLEVRGSLGGTGASDRVARMAAEMLGEVVAP
jgi:lipid-A-disaccharide synthase